LNVTGSVHDSTLAEWGGIYTHLKTTFDRTGAICCADSAFAAAGNDYMIRSAEDVTRAETELEVAQMKEARTSLRQASEWGMRAIQSAFLRLKETIKYESAGNDDEVEDTKLERRLVLKLMVLLYNFRLEKVGLNQLRNVYVPGWSQDATYMAFEDEDEDYKDDNE
jgi:hypothetical protein